jgi:DHA2 family methylenomycin A resistance protein-like MFS transporter
LHYSAIETGLAYLPLTAGFFAVNLLSGWWVGKAGSRPPMMVGALVDALGFLLLCLLGAQSPYWLMLPAFLLMPGGMGLGVPAMTAAIMGSVEKSASGVAAAVSTATRQAGGAIGVALFGALAGKDPARMVAGLHLAAMIAVGLLLVAAVLTWFGLRGASATRSARQPTGRPAPQPARQAD